MQVIEESKVTHPPNTLHWLDIAAGVWILLALVSLVPLTAWLNTAFPIFTIVWLVVPLIFWIRTRCASRIGMRPIGWQQFATYGVANFALTALLMILFEPWSHTYQALLAMAFLADPPDPTFAWVVRYPGGMGLAGMFLFSFAVTLFGEELFFRGWLLQILLKRMRPVWAILLQAFLFSLPQALAALFLSPLQAILYIVVYAWLAIGIINGWSAWRTHSLWPGLVSAALINLVLTALLS